MCPGVTFHSQKEMNTIEMNLILVTAPLGDKVYVKLTEAVGHGLSCWNTKYPSSGKTPA